jgi:MFS family permease
VVVSFTIMTVAWIPYYSFGVFFTPMLTEFGWSRALTSGAFSTAQVIRGLFGIVMGRLNDKAGPRLVLTVCGLLLGLSFILMYTINSLWQFYLYFTFLMGIALGGFWVPITSTTTRWFTRRRATMTGIVITGTGLATLIGAPFASFLLSILNWRIAYALMGVGVILIIPACAQFLRREPGEMGLSPDGGKIDPKAEKKGLSGVSLSEALHSSQFWFYFFAGTCMAYSVFTVTVHIVPYALDLKLSPVAAASVLAAYGGMSLVGRLILGNAADRIGERKIYLYGFIIVAASLIWLLLAHETWMLYVFAGIFGMAQGGMGTVGSALLAEMFGLRSHGLIFGVGSAGYTFGAALGPFASGFLFDLTGSYQLAFIACLIIIIIGLILAALLIIHKSRYNFT